MMSGPKIGNCSKMKNIIGSILQYYFEHIHRYVHGAFEAAWVDHIRRDLACMASDCGDVDKGCGFWGTLNCEDETVRIGVITEGEDVAKCADSRGCF
jgi:hypothetical protein